MGDDLMGGIGIPGSAEAKARRRGYKSAEIEREDLVKKIKNQESRLKKAESLLKGARATIIRLYGDVFPNHDIHNSDYIAGIDEYFDEPDYSGYQAWPP
jgi:hypothetical protein